MIVPAIYKSNTLTVEIQRSLNVVNLIFNINGSEIIINDNSIFATRTDLTDQQLAKKIHQTIENDGSILIKLKDLLYKQYSGRLWRFI